MNAFSALANHLVDRAGKSSPNGSDATTAVSMRMQWTLSAGRNSSACRRPAQNMLANGWLSKAIVCCPTELMVEWSCPRHDAQQWLFPS